MADGVVSDLVVSLCCSCSLSNLFFIVSFASFPLLPNSRKMERNQLDVHSDGFGCLITGTEGRFHGKDLNVEDTIILLKTFIAGGSV